MRCCEDLKRRLILKLKFQAGEMVANTLCYASYQNRSSDRGRGRAIAEESGGKVNASTMCAEGVWHLSSFTLDTTLSVKMKALARIALVS